MGGVANAVLSALARSELDHLSVYTEVMQDAVVELIDAGKVACASGTALTISPSARERFYAHIDDYKGKIILRPQELSNAPEVIRRLSIIDLAAGKQPMYNEDGTVSIELHIVVENGVNIATVCRSIMSEVKYVVTKNTGVEVREVNVCVDSVTV